MSNLRNSHVALSNLRVKSHTVAPRASGNTGALDGGGVPISHVDLKKC